MLLPLQHKLAIFGTRFACPMGLTVVTTLNADGPSFIVTLPNRLS